MESDEIHPLSPTQSRVDSEGVGSIDRGDEKLNPVVYLVDDDPHVLKSMQRALNEIGIVPAAFERADDMLAALGTESIGCVITDLRMPGLNGAELQKALCERGSFLSVIVLTAYADVAVAVELMKNGAAAVIEKPFRSQRLCSEVEAAIELSRKGFMRRRRVLNAREKLKRLTSEEIAVLDFACRGVPNRQIGIELSLSNRTIDRRRQSAMQKLNVDSVADFAVLRTLAETSD